MKILIIIFILIITGCSFEKKQTPIPNNQNLNLSDGSSKKIKSYQEKEITLGEAYTNIIDAGKNRVSNINLACSAISSMALYPDEEFSFNDVTGEKTTRRGYKEAPIIIDGEKSYGIGGGVCQVSTTIYQAAKSAGFEITEHHNHSESVAYAPNKTDATVVFGYKDLKFKNNTDETIYIYTWIQDNKVFAKIIKKSIDIG